MRNKKFLLGLTSLSLVSAITLPLSSCSMGVKLNNNQNIRTTFGHDVNDEVNIPVFVDDEGFDADIKPKLSVIHETEEGENFYVVPDLPEEYVVDGIHEIKCGGYTAVEGQDYTIPRYDTELQGVTFDFNKVFLLNCYWEYGQPIVITPKIVTEKNHKIVLQNHSVSCVTNIPITYKNTSEVIFNEGIKLTRSAISPYVLSDKIDVTCGNSEFVLYNPDEPSADYDYKYTLDEDKFTGTIVFNSDKKDEIQNKLIDDLMIRTNLRHTYGEEDLIINVNGTNVETIEQAVPDVTKTFEVFIPSWIHDKGKKINSVHGATLAYEDGTPISVDDVAIDDNKVTFTWVNDYTFTEGKNVVAKFDLTYRDNDHNFNKDSWSDLIFWTKLFNEDSNKIASSYGFEEKEGHEPNYWILGEQRTIVWDRQPHKIEVASTNQLHFTFNDWHEKYAHWRDTSVWQSRLNQNPTAAFTFKFVNVLTDHNGDTVKRQFEHSHTIDGEMNHWVHNEKQDDCFEYPDYVAVHGISSSIRSFVRDKKNFLDKFEDQELIKAIPTIAMSHLIWWGIHPDSPEAIVSDKFFIPTASQVGAPEKNDGEHHWYYTETKTGPFNYYDKAHRPEKPDRDEPCWWRTCTNTLDQREEYWVATPSSEGSGLGNTEQMVTIRIDGKTAHCAMDKKRAVLPCFCL